MAQPEHKVTSSWRANHLNNALRLIGFILLLAVAMLFYRYLVRDVLKTKQHYFTYFIVTWLLLAYVILPRIYRWLSKAFLPGYFIGRTQTGDGVLGDPVNLAIVGSEEALIQAMVAAGWKRADKLSLGSSFKMVYSAVIGTSYTSAPVSSLFLFDNKQDLAFEKDVGGNPRKRHHARFWETPEDWWLPGGYKADWLGAATFDENVGLSLFTGQITHKIDSNVDKERDFVVSGLKKSAETITWVKHFTSSYNSRNGGGDIIHTDGALPFVKFKS
jgi:LssY C-terminus